MNEVNLGYTSHCCQSSETDRLRGSGMREWLLKLALPRRSAGAFLRLSLALPFSKSSYLALRQLSQRDFEQPYLVLKIGKSKRVCWVYNLWNDDPEAVAAFLKLPVTLKCTADVVLPGISHRLTLLELLARIEAGHVGHFWGVNDFDEAHPMAFTNDLVRLTVSAFLAADSNPAFDIKRTAICQEILRGYRECLKKGGAPYVLMEKHPLLRAMAQQDLRQPLPFWERLEAKTTLLSAKKVPSSVRAAIQAISPEVDFEMRVVRTPKGLGSLGRQRFLAVGSWQGGMLAREAKAVAPSSLLWAEGRKPTRGNPYLDKTVRSAVRCQDPYYETRKGWLVRRLGPDCSRIDLAELSHHHDRALLLRCMGAETANIHLGGKKARRRILKDLGDLPEDWLLAAAEKMHSKCLDDWKKFRGR